MSLDRIPMTRDGYEKLKSDLDRMQNHEMIEVTRRIAAARDLGDLSENAEYHAAREDQGMLQARIDALKDKSAAVKTKAANLLEQIGPDASAAIPALEQLARDDDASVREHAQAALKRIKSREK